MRESKNDLLKLLCSSWEAADIGDLSYHCKEPTVPKPLGIAHELIGIPEFVEDEISSAFEMVSEDNTKRMPSIFEMGQTESFEVNPVNDTVRIRVMTDNTWMMVS